MAISQASFNNGEEEEYIDIEVNSSSSKFLCYSISSPPQSREFEFQMCSVDINGEITSNSPADELFYKGKLLPLHLPPRLQMVQKLVQCSDVEAPFEANSQVAIGSSNRSSTSTPMESCRVSCELNPDDDCFLEWSNGLAGNNTNRLCSKKLKQKKQSSIIAQKLKASREYLKSLFTKPGCSDESCAKAASCNAEQPENVSKMSKYMKMAKKNPFGKIDKDGHKKVSNIVMKSSIDRELAENVVDIHRRSFSGVIQRQSATNSSLSSSGSSSSSTSFSFSSSGYCDLQLLKLKRSNSANENSIEGAIAHCKQSQKLGACSLSKISVCGDQERSELCRI